MFLEYEPNQTSGPNILTRLEAANCRTVMDLSENAKRYVTKVTPCEQSYSQGILFIFDCLCYIQ